MSLFPVILAGGTGTRLWPVSRRDLPKQFMALTAAADSLFQLTVKRIAAAFEDELEVDLCPPLVITNEEYRFTVDKALSDLRLADYKVILEPAPKNTAPAIALAAQYIKHFAEVTDMMLVVPADAFIKEDDKFALYLKQAVKHYQDSLGAPATLPLYTFGVKPTHPHTGYGYIKAATASSGLAKVAEFKEKPHYELAKNYLAQGCYYWNSGMFLLRADVYLERLAILQPEILKATDLQQAEFDQDDKFVRPPAELFAKSPADSIDYAVMEKDNNILMQPFELTWSDVGSWDSLAALYEKDAAGNSCRGQAVMQDSKNSFVMAAGERVVATLGIEDTTVIDTPDALLVLKSASGEQVKDLVAELAKRDIPQAKEQYRSYRPWGWYESLIKRDGFQVKRLAVYPQAKLSLQSHKHRSEHWVVVSGVALVTRDEEEMALTSNQSVYIPLGAKHRLANPGQELLTVIEVQSGSYLGEDDIVRYQDIYDRS